MSTSETILSLVATIGPSRVANRLLEAKTLDLISEDFLREHLASLDSSQLIRWLSKEEPVGANGRRPTSEIVERIYEDLPRDDLSLALFSASSMAEIRDVDARDDIVERLHRHMGPWAWMQFAKFARCDSAFFKAVMERELRIVEQHEYPPSYVWSGESIPLLTYALFGERRDEVGFLRGVRSALLEQNRRNYSLWLLVETKVLTRIGSVAEVLPNVPTMGEGELDDDRHLKFLLAVAEHWPDAEVREWRIQRFLDARARGASWARLYWEIPAELRDEVALRTFHSDSPAPWVLGALGRKLAPAEAWAEIFDLHYRGLLGGLSTTDDAKELGASMYVAERAHGSRPSHSEIERAFQEFDSDQRWGVIANAPLPEAPADDFDAKFVAVAEHLKLSTDIILDRLLTLPLTAARARRVWDALSEDVWQHPRCRELARAVGPVGREIAPPWRITRETIDAYRIVAGSEADAKLAARLRKLIADPKRLDEALHLVSLASEIATEEDGKRLRDHALERSVVRLVLMQSSFPWFITEADVIARAVATDCETWGDPGLLPAYLLPVMLAKAVTTANAGLASLLFDRAETLGTQAREVLSFVTRRLQERGPEALSLSWVARKFNSNSLWKDTGPGVIEILLGEVDGTAIRRVRNFFFEAPTIVAETDLTRAKHTAFGAALVNVVERALAKGNEGLARDALTALANLNPGSFLKNSVRRLRRLEGAASIATLIDANENLLRRNGAEDGATSGALWDALAALVGNDTSESAS